MVYDVTPRYDVASPRLDLEDKDVTLRRVRSWSSGISSLKTMIRGKTPFSRSSSSEHGTASKTMLWGKKTFSRSSSSEHGTAGTRGDETFSRTTTSSSGFSDALTVTHEEVDDGGVYSSSRGAPVRVDSTIANEVDSTIADFQDQAAASDEVESALSDCASPPSAMLLAFASVESWGGSAGAKGTDHYGAGYHKVALGRRGLKP